jgi:tRNA 2-thiouridine synthesizing protein A
MKLDVRGEICPYPMMKATDALKRLRVGDTLEVVTDHPPALATIPWEAAKLGYRAEIAEADHSEWRITLRRAEGALDPMQVVAELAESVQRAMPRNEP